MAPSSSSPVSSKSSISSTSQDTTKSNDGRSTTIKTKSAHIDKRKRLAANARERKRMNLLNKAYDQLRKRLNDAENKSKYDVLVQAKEYIQALAKICADFDRANPKHPSAIGASQNQPAAQEARALPCSLEVSRKLDPGDDRLGQLTVAASATVGPYLKALQSPESPSDCLSPISLPDSVASSTSSHCSSFHASHQTAQPQSQQSRQQTQLDIRAAHYRMADYQPFPSGKAAFLLQTNCIKQSQLDELPADYHQLYHQHYHSFFHAHKEAAL